MARATERTAPVAESLTPGRRSKAAVPRGRLSSRVNGAVVRSARPRACTAPGAAGAPYSWSRSWLAALSLGMAALAVGGLAIAVALTVLEVRRARGGASVRPGFAVAAGALYLASVPYLVFFIWLWFVD